MPFQMTFDIEEYSGEAIVYSDYNIDSNILIIKVDNQLDSKYIIRVKPPLKEYDRSNKALLKLYNDILEETINNNIFKICLPLLGLETYTQKASYNAAMKAISDILFKEEQEDRDILDITLVVSPEKYERKPKVLSNMDFLEFFECKSAFNLEIRDSKTDYLKRIIKVTHSQVDNMINIDNKHYEFPMYFLDDYLNTVNGDTKCLTKAGYDKRRKDQLYKQKNIKKIDIYRIAFIAKMNIGILIQFLMIAGLSLNPTDILDCFILDYYTTKKYSKAGTFYEFVQLVYWETGIDLTLYPYNKKIKDDKQTDYSKTLIENNVNSSKSSSGNQFKRPDVSELTEDDFKVLDNFLSRNGFEGVSREHIIEFYNEGLFDDLLVED